MKLCDFEIGLDKRFFLIAGTCVIESEQMAMDTAGQLKEITSALGIPFIYKSSFTSLIIIIIQIIKKTFFIIYILFLI
jgi:3-deoxy-D-manno-octulosonic acid (KDO) 8-phosphate synthase